MDETFLEQESERRPDSRAPIRTVPPAFEPGASGERVFDELLRRYARAIAINLDLVVSSSDPQGVHQLRVALRRLRSLLKSFSGMLDRDSVRGLRRQARKLGRIVSDLRDADVVVLEQIRPSARPDLAETKALSEIESWREHLRSQARHKLHEARATDFSARLLLLAELSSWRSAKSRKRCLLAAHAIDQLQPALERMWVRVQDSCVQLAQLTSHERHSLRKRLKTLRDTAEIVSQLAAFSGAAEFLAILEGAIGALGELNDAESFERLKLRSAKSKAFRRLEDGRARSARRGGKAQHKAARDRTRQLACLPPFWRNEADTD